MRKFFVLMAGIAVIFMFAPTTASAECGVCGDVTGDGVVNISDVVALVDYFTKFIFPDCIECGDVNCDNGVTILDLNYLVDWMFYAGPPLCDPEDDGEFCGPCL